jgi:hypothetical protein
VIAFYGDLFRTDPHGPTSRRVGDPVADGSPVADVFDGIASFRVVNGHRAHDPESYLCATVTSAAIRAGIDRSSKSNPSTGPAQPSH